MAMLQPMILQGEPRNLLHGGIHADVSDILLEGQYFSDLL